MTPRLCASGGSSTWVAAATGCRFTGCRFTGCRCLQDAIQASSEVGFYQHSVPVPSLQASCLKLHVSVHQRRLYFFFFFLSTARSPAKLHQCPRLFRECLPTNLTAGISADPLLTVQVANKSTEVNPLYLFPE